MNLKTAKTIRKILLIVACVAFIAGVSMSQQAAKEAATDLSKISVKITDKECYYNQNETYYINGCYHIDFTYEIKNKAKVDWRYLSITTYVYDNDGTSLGTITSEFGSHYGDSDLRLKVGGTVIKKSGLKDNQPDKFFTTLYESDLSELRFESEVTYGVYIEK